MNIINNIKELPSNSSVHIYGAGSFGMMLNDSIDFHRKDLKVINFIDGYKTGEFLNLPIISLDNFIAKHDSEHIIIIATDPVYWKEIAENFEKVGIENYFVNKFHDYDIYGKKEVGKINKYKKLINAVSEILEDNEDKIKWKIITDSMVKSNVNDSLEYLNKDKTKNNTSHENYLEFGVKLHEGDVVIDGGSYDGPQTAIFSKMIGASGKVYAFEPRALLKNQSDDYELNNVEVIPKALWDKKTTMFFLENSGRTVVSTHKVSDSTRVDGISIDEFIQENDIKSLQLIKFDIEGAEMEGLRGGAESIKRFRPKLVISIYHKLEHYFEIPIYLKSILPDYRFKFGLNHPFGVGTLLFAIPPDC
jgi:FkbM family methyltransferase